MQHACPLFFPSLQKSGRQKNDRDKGRQKEKVRWRLSVIDVMVIIVKSMFRSPMTSFFYHVLEWDTGSYSPHFKSHLSERQTEMISFNTKSSMVKSGREDDNSN